MKIALFILGCGIGMLQAEAQNVFVGGKIGVTNWFTAGKNKENFIRNSQDGKRLTFTTELFSRYHTKGNFAFELGVSYTKREMAPVGTSWMCTWGGYDSTYNTYSRRFIDLNVGIQYKIGLPCQAKYPILRKFSNYLGIIITPSLITTGVNTVYTSTLDGPMVPYTEHHSIRNQIISTGLSYTLIYSISEQLNIISSVNTKINTLSYFNFNRNTMSNMQVNIGIGASYKL